MSNIEELRKQLREAEEADRLAVIESAKSVPIEWEWTASWGNSNYVFYCSKRLSEKTRKAMKEWENKHPTMTFPSKPWGDNVGMTYVLCGDLLFVVGGGHLILKGAEGEDTFSHEPRKLTKAEVKDLHRGVVPESLKR